jgi:hypothetical protein
MNEISQQTRSKLMVSQDVGNPTSGHSGGSRNPDSIDRLRNVWTPVFTGVTISTESSSWTLKVISVAISRAKNYPHAHAF